LGGAASVSFYDTRGVDLIGFDSAFNVVNIDRARIRGSEWVGHSQLGAWRLEGNLSLISPEDKMRGTRLARRAEKLLTLKADYAFGDWRTGLVLQAEGARFNDAANTLRLGGYAVANVWMECALNKAWRLQGRIDNVFDRTFETVAYYPQPGRSGLITLRYSR
jgi:vitamin B12 transporter